MRSRTLLLFIMVVAGAALASDVQKPASAPAGATGVQVWSENTDNRITVQDLKNAAQGLHSVKIIAARNGSFCGQLVIGSDAPFKGVKVVPGALKSVNGDGVIPADKITVLYALPNVSFYAMPTWFDALQPEPPAEVAVAKNGGALLPVLLRVVVPHDAPPGDYRGEAAVNVAGNQAIKVPIELNVAGWSLPDPKDYRSYTGVYQSPTTLAMKYNVKEWSEEHWKLMEKSFALLARAGNRLVNITVVDKTQFGNEDGMITWIRKPDGSYGYDFAVFDRYLDLAQKYFPSLEFVALHIWHSGGWDTRKADQENTVTVVDQNTGARQHLQVPLFATEESKNFWKPFFEAARERLAKRGLEKAMLIGILSDGTAPKEVLASLQEIIPGGARWMRGLHSQRYDEKPYSLPGGGCVVLHEFCYGFGLPDPNKPLPAYWKQRTWPGADYDRISNHERYAPMSWYRQTAMTALMKRTRGVGRVCLDFWPVLPKGADIYNRWPFSSCAQREPSMKYLTWPAPDGAGTTLRYEAFCEGIQFAEAMIVVSQAVDTNAEALGKEKADAFHQVLVDLVQQARSRTKGPLQPADQGFQDVIKRLFDAAAECAKLGPAKPAAK